MSKKLATAVHLTDESGIVHSFLPGATPPKWARKLITNPKAWAESDEADAADVDGADDSTGADQSEASESDAAGADESDATGADEANGDQSDTAEVAIPRKNAKTEVWRAYADAKGFETDDDISRSEIIAGLKSAGIPTE